MISASTYPNAVIAGHSRHGRSVGIALLVGIAVLAVGALWFGGKPQVRIAIPAAAVVVGLVLYLARPVAYVQYALWVWFLTPLARRIVDWRFGFVDPSVILLAPFLVSGISVLALLPSRNKPSTRPPAAFILCAAGILYGFIVGLVLHPSAETVFGLLNWLCPLLFGLYLYIRVEHYEEFRDAICKTFLWGVLLLGVYGIYQFVFLPAWDRYWLENVLSTSASFGRPEAFAVRVWSTLNSPGPFANFMMAGLLLLFTIRASWKLPAAVSGYLSFLLSIVRTAWLSWAVGLFLLLKSTRPRLIIRILISLVFLAACLLALMSDPRVTTMVGDRVNSFVDLSHDDSFDARLGMYHLLLGDLMQSPFGHGLKNLEVSHGLAVDSGILTMVFSLGWLGSALFATGILFLFLGGKDSSHTNDQFSIVGKSIMIAILVQVVGGNIFVNVTGAIFWLFAGMYAVGYPSREGQTLDMPNGADECLN